MISRKKTKTYYFLFFSYCGLIWKIYWIGYIFRKSVTNRHMLSLFLFILGGEDLEGKENITGNRLQLGSWPKMEISGKPYWEEGREVCNRTAQAQFESSRSTELSSNTFIWALSPYSRTLSLFLSPSDFIFY